MSINLVRLLNRSAWHMTHDDGRKTLCGRAVDASMDRASHYTDEEYVAQTCATKCLTCSDIWHNWRRSKP